MNTEIPILKDSKISKRIHGSNLNLKYVDEIDSVAINNTTKEILKQIDGTNTIDTIINNLHLLYNGVDEKTIRFDLLSILFRLWKVREITWKNELHPFKEYFENNSKYGLIKLLTEEELTNLHFNRYQYKNLMYNGAYYDDQDNTIKLNFLDFIKVFSIFCDGNEVGYIKLLISDANNGNIDILEYWLKDSIKDNLKNILIEIDDYFMPFYEIEKRDNNNYLIYLENTNIKDFSSVTVANEIDGYSKIHLNILNIKRRSYELRKTNI